MQKYHSESIKNVLFSKIKIKMAFHFMDLYFLLSTDLRIRSLLNYLILFMQKSEKNSFTDVTIIAVILNLTNDCLLHGSL